MWPPALAPVRSPARPDRPELSTASSFYVDGHRCALILQALCVEFIGARTDRHEEQFGLAFVLELDLIDRVGLDLQAAGFDLAQPDVVEEVRRDDGIFLHARRSDEQAVRLARLEVVFLH